MDERYVTDLIYMRWFIRQRSIHVIDVDSDIIHARFIIIYLSTYSLPLSFFSATNLSIVFIWQSKINFFF